MGPDMYVNSNNFTSMNMLMPLPDMKYNGLSMIEQLSDIFVLLNLNHGPCITTYENTLIQRLIQ